MEFVYICDDSSNFLRYWCPYTVEFPELSNWGHWILLLFTGLFLLKSITVTLYWCSIQTFKRLGLAWVHGCGSVTLLCDCTLLCASRGRVVVQRCHHCSTVHSPEREAEPSLKESMESVNMKKMNNPSTRRTMQISITVMSYKGKHPKEAHT